MARRKTMQRTRWTKQEVRQLKKSFPKMRTAEVAEELGRSVPSVQQKAVNLGLAKSRRHLKSIGRA